MVECFLLDMDGVIANFVERSLNACSIPLSHDEYKSWGYFQQYMTAEQFWKLIEADEYFWFKLTPYDWAREIVDTLEAIAPVIYCSTPSRDSRAAQQKIDWLREYAFMGETENRYHLVGVAPSADGHKFGKNMLATPDRILIDDHDGNCEDFIASGGHAILFPQPWNKASQHTGDRISYVKRQLQKIMLKMQQCKIALDEIQADIEAETEQTQPENPKDAVGFLKPPTHVIPQHVLYEVGMGLFEGAWKYRSYNYRKISIRYSRYFDAVKRHLDDWWEGEDIDPDSKLSHITKAISCLVVLRDAMIQAEHGGTPVIDDRPPKSKVKMSHMAEVFKEMLHRLREQHGEMKPPYTAQNP